CLPGSGLAGPSVGKLSASTDISVTMRLPAGQGGPGWVGCLWSCNRWRSPTMRPGTSGHTIITTHGEATGPAPLGAQWSACSDNPCKRSTERPAFPAPGADGTGGAGEAAYCTGKTAGRGAGEAGGSGPGGG